MTPPYATHSVFKTTSPPLLFSYSLSPLFVIIINKMSHFSPKLDTPQFDSSNDKRIQICGLRSSFVSELRASEVCLGKCNVELTPTMSEQESGCLR